MIGLTDPEAVVLAAVLPVVIGTIYSAWQARRTQAAIKTAASEYRPNGGATLRDAIDRVEASVERLHVRHDHLSDRITLIEDHVTTPKRGNRAPSPG
jgi:hypothetical protein